MSISGYFLWEFIGLSNLEGKLSMTGILQADEKFSRQSFTINNTLLKGFSKSLPNFESRQCGQGVETSFIP